MQLLAALGLTVVGEGPAISGILLPCAVLVDELVDGARALISGVAERGVQIVVGRPQHALLAVFTGFIHQTRQIAVSVVAALSFGAKFAFGIHCGHIGQSRPCVHGHGLAGGRSRSRVIEHVLCTGRGRIGKRESAIVLTGPRLTVAHLLHAGCIGIP